jgi:hypothetical protein
LIRSNRRQVEAEIDRRLNRKLETIGIIVVNGVKRRIRNYGLIDTGRLINSITYLVESGRVVIGTNVSYAIYLHEGTIHIRPMPFLVNGLMDSKGQIAGILEAA